MTNRPRISESERLFRQTMRVLDGESDRGAVLVGADFVEDALGHAVKARIPASTSMAATARDALFGKRGPLSTGWARQQFGVATGLLDENLSRALDEIRLLRNSFAHTHAKVDFLATEPAKRINAMRRIVKDWYEPSVLRSLSALLVGSSQAVRRARARVIFGMAVSYIVGYLYGFAEGYNAGANKALQPSTRALRNANSNQRSRAARG